MATNVLEARGGSLVPPVAQRGYHIVYRDHETNYCPGCGRTHWYIGRIMAECAFCGTALPLESAPLIAGGQIIRTVRRHPFVAAQAWEEYASLAAVDGDRGAAVAGMERALRTYENSGASVDRGRLLARLRACGVRRGPRSAHSTAVTGWAMPNWMR